MTVLDRSIHQPVGSQMIVLRIARGVTTHFVTRWGEWVKSAIMVAMGFQLQRPDELFATYPIYRVMAAVASENAWGSLLILIGGIRLMALAINGTFQAYRLSTLTPLIRSALSFLSAGVWFALAWGYWAALPGGIGFIMAAGLMLCDLGLCLNIAREAGAADMRFRQHGSGK